MGICIFYDLSNFKYRVNIAFPLWALFYMNIVFDLLKTKGIKIDLRLIFFFVCVWYKTVSSNSEPIGYEETQLS